MDERFVALEYVLGILGSDQPLGPLPEIGLMLSKQRGDGDGGSDIGHRIMGITMLDVIGGGQILQSEGWCAIISKRPLDSRGSQRPGGSGEIDQVPGAAIVLVGVFVWIKEVPPESEPGHRLIEPGGVPSKRYGSGRVEHSMDFAEEGGFCGTSGGRHLWCNTRHQTGFRCRQSITGGLAPRGRLITRDRIQLLIGSDGGELARAADGGFCSIGLEIVEEE